MNCGGYAAGRLPQFGSDLHNQENREERGQKSGHPNIGPLGHEHLNLVGNYDFEDGQQYSLDHPRPLRSVNETEIADEEDIEAYVALSGLC